MNIWDFQAKLSRRLLMWSGVSTLLGIAFSFVGTFWRGVGGQFIGWAAVNAVIALGGDFAAQQRRARLADSGMPKRQTIEAEKLRGLLWLNAGLDILYMLGGLLLWGRNKAKPGLRGTGLGIFLQGLFLFVFDVIHARQTPSWPWNGGDPKS